MNLTVLTSFVALMMAVSVAVERMVEVLKGWFPNSWLFKANTDPTQEARRCAWIHVLAGAFGYGLSIVRAKPDYRDRLGSEILNRSLTTSLNFCLQPMYRSVVWTEA